ncbi:MAG TPA: hypothetical protein VH369_22415 [Bryobacteraceae bacterium]
MATEAQIAANQANAKLSSGPMTEAGKAASSKNHVIHGLNYRGGMFILLPWESAEEFDYLVIDLKNEYGPKNPTELILVERMAQHHWLRNRATMLQGLCFLDDGTIDDKRLALYLRYETTHERAFHKCLNELLKIRAEKRKAEIGFESQKRKQEEHDRKQEQHKMKKDLHGWAVTFAEAKVDHQKTLTDSVKTLQDIAQWKANSQKAES